MRCNFFMLVLLFLVSSCYVDQIDRKPQTPGTTSEDDGLTLTKSPKGHRPQCQMDKQTGCFEGEIPSAPNLRVEGKEFFDADALRDRFAELINTDKPENSAAKKEEVKYTVKLLTPIDNINFSKGFYAFIKGEYSKSTQPLPSGKFSLHFLEPGEYQIRVQKTIKFDLIKETKKAPPAQEGTVTDPNQPTTPPQPTEPTTVVETKTYCGKLYSDSALEITQQERSHFVFDDYSLYVTNHACTDEEGVELSF